jgi:enoyl-CoA hydratase/carnithine racemase
MQVNEFLPSGALPALAIHRCRKPTIVAVNGSAVGIGVTMILTAAIRVAYENAKVGFVFGRRGLVMEAASHYFLPRLIGHSKALHLITTGGVYPANHSLVSSLFTETLPTPEATVDRAIELASDIAENTSILTWALNRDLMWRGGDSAEAAHLLDSRVLFDLYTGKDVTEGVKSFLEKRKPQFEASFADPQDVPTAYPWWTPVDINTLPKPSKL